MRPAPGAFLPADPRARAVAVWLWLCAAMVFAMVVLGGLTRLTGSGLSIADWRPLTGILPPFDEADWQALFARYQATPEYRRVNFWMTVADFRAIFWLEYAHRLWGRLIGVAFGAPFLVFLLRGGIDRPLGIRLAVLFLLGGAQGVLGWYMVRSGLVDRPEVSQYRLAAHLMLAVGLYGYLVWTALGIGARRARPARLRGHFAVVFAIAAATMCWGALVAGLDAGHVHATFPLMGGSPVPAEFLSLSPWPADLAENAATVQFLHRVLATCLLAAVLALWWRGRGRALAWLAAIALLQYGLGVAALLGGVPTGLAAAHQAGGLALLTAAVVALHFRAREAAT